MRVIVLLNGPFGVGKTTAARLLVERLPTAMVYNPEVIGSSIRLLARSIKPADDYQDYALWRVLTVQAARLLRAMHRKRALIIPMCITRRDYYAVITDGFRRIDPDLACFRLIASIDVLRARIVASKDVAAMEWRLGHMEHGVATLQDPAFGLAIRTDGRRPEAVVGAIMAALPGATPGLP